MTSVLLCCNIYNMNTISITKAAAQLGVGVKTLQRWDRQGKLRAGRTVTNRRYYTQEQLRAFLQMPVQKRRIVVYCRVSSQAQRPDLKNQRKVLEDFCSNTGLSNVDYVEEIGGGLNFTRPKFTQLIDDIVSGQVAKLLIAHKDRLARFGFPLLHHICEFNGCELLVLNNEQLSPEQEMVQDLMSIVHCFSSRLYGLRNYRKALKEALIK